jgi:hypothetical protein
LYYINNEGVKPQLKQEIKMETLQTSTPIEKVEKVDVRKVKVSYDDNYGNKGNKAWLVQKFFNGKVDGDPYGHLVIKGEHFNDIGEFIEKWINEGYEVEIKKDNN